MTRPFTDEELRQMDAEQGSRLLLNAILKLRARQHQQALGFAVHKPAGRAGR